MSQDERYVVLGLARPRTEWFNELGRWATSAVLPLEYIKSLGAGEVRARLDSGRTFSALIVESDVPGLDRDLIDGALARGCAVIVIDDARVDRDWAALGVSAVLSPGFDRDQLLSVLDQFATGVGNRIAHRATTNPTNPTEVNGWRGRFVSVTGPGGSGSSTIAAALAQVCGQDIRYERSTLLADLALHADQAVLHDTREMMPGLPELIEAHRSGAPAPEQVREGCFSIDGSPYDLLAGLRRHRDWTGLRPRAVDAALDGLQHAYGMTVADIEPDVEGEAQCGSIDVEERNLLARQSALRSDAVIVVGQPSTVGVHRLLGLVLELIELGVMAPRIVPVLNRAPRSMSRRGELTRAVSTLLETATGTRVGPFAGPIFLPTRRRVETARRDGELLPRELGRPLLAALDAVLDAVDPHPGISPAEPVSVTPGSIGHLSDPDPSI